MNRSLRSALTWSALVRMLALLVTILVYGVLGHRHGETVLGLYIVGASVSSVLASLIVGSAAPLVIRFRSAPPGSPEWSALRRVRAWTTAATLFASSTVFFAVSIGVFPPLQGYPDAALPVLLWVIGSVATAFSAEELRALYRVGVAAAIVQIAPNILFVAALLLLPSTAATTSALWAAAVTSAVTGLLAALVARSVPPTPLHSRSTDLVDRASSLRSSRGRSYAMANAAALALNQGDIWLVAALAGPAEAGVYGVASRLVILGMTPLSMIQQATQPHIMTSIRLGSVRPLAQTLATMTAVLGLVAGLLLAALGEPLAAVAFDIRSPRLVPVLILLLAGRCLDIVSGPTQSLLLLSGQAASAAAASWLSLIVSVSIVVALVGQFPSAVLVAISWAIGLTIQAIVWIGSVRHGLGFWPLPLAPNKWSVRRIRHELGQVV